MTTIIKTCANCTHSEKVNEPSCVDCTLGSPKGWEHDGIGTCKGGENMELTSRKMINEYKENPKKAIEQLEFCGYECEGGVMANNVAFIALKELVMEEEEI